MKRIVIIMALLIVSLTFTFGQTVSDSISMKKVFGGYQFYQGGKMLNMNKLVTAMKPNEEAYKQIKSAQSNYTVAMVCSYAGGFMIGWPVGTALGGGEPNWLLAGVGAGLIVATIPILKGYNNKARLAVDTYNGGLLSSSNWDKRELNLSMTASGIGFSLRF
jgi:hypothetical protein